MSQNKKILAYLKTGNSLTCKKAYDLGFGMNLRSRISNLIEQGIIIDKSVRTVLVDGHSTNVKVYRIKNPISPGKVRQGIIT